MTGWLYPEDAVAWLSVGDLVWCLDKDDRTATPAVVHTRTAQYPTVLLPGIVEPVSFFCFYKLRKIECSEIYDDT